MVLLQVDPGTFHVDLLLSRDLSADPIKICRPGCDVLEVRRFKSPGKICAL